MTRRQLVVPALLLAMVAPLVVAVGPAQAVVDVSVLSLRSDPADPYLKGASVDETPTTSYFGVSGGPYGMSASISQKVKLGHAWQVDIGVRGGQQLEVGKTYAYDGDISGQVTMGVAVDNHACTYLTGSFTVLQNDYDPVTFAAQHTAFTFEAHCEGVAAALRGTVMAHATFGYSANAKLALGGSPTAPPGMSIGLHGSLTTPAAVVGAIVHVTRDDGTGAVALPDATTDAAGAYRVSDIMSATPVLYTARFDGNAAAQPLTTTWTVSPGAYTTTLSVVLPRTVQRGTAYTAYGVLEAGGTPLGAMPVTLHRTDLAGVKVFTVTTNRLGVWAIRDVPAVGGTVSWTAYWGGNELRLRVTTTRSLVVPRYGTSLTVTTSAKSYVYGQRARLTIHLGTTYNSRYVYVYARPLGTSLTAPGNLVTAARVDSAGYLRISYLLRRRTAFTIKFLGDYRYNPATRLIAPPVLSKVTVTPKGYQSTSSSGYVFRGTNPTFAVSSLPSGEEAVGYAQKWTGSSWVPLTGGGIWTFFLDSPPTGTTLLIRTGLPHGVRLRMRVASYPTSFSSTGYSPWVYFVSY